VKPGDQIRIGIIGGGSIAAQHLGGYLKVPEAATVNAIGRYANSSSDGASRRTPEHGLPGPKHRADQHGRPCRTAPDRP